MTNEMNKRRIAHALFRIFLDMHEPGFNTVYATPKERMLTWQEHTEEQEVVTYEQAIELLLNWINDVTDELDTDIYAYVCRDNGQLNIECFTHEELLSEDIEIYEENLTDGIHTLYIGWD